MSLSKKSKFYHFDILQFFLTFILFEALRPPMKLQVMYTPRRKQNINQDPLLSLAPPLSRIGFVALTVLPGRKRAP